jgi:COMPASS component SWD3
MISVPIATGMDDSSTDDDAASQTTEDDPQVPENQDPAPVPQPAPTAPTPASREKPHYELRHTIYGHAKSLSAVRFSHDGIMLASCGLWIRLHAYILTL